MNSCGSGYDVIGFNVFLRKLMRFLHKKVNSLPTILLLSMLIDPCSDNLWNIGGIRIPQSGKLLFVESEILGFGMRNTAERIRNLTSDWNPESKTALDSGPNMWRDDLPNIGGILRILGLDCHNCYNALSSLHC